MVNSADFDFNIKNTQSMQQVNGMTVSFGIAPILSVFTDFANRASKPTWSLYLINVETLIRDRKSKSEPIDARNVLFDCTVMAQYIAMYNRLIPTREVPVICFYLPQYENLPPTLLRTKFPAGTEERWKIRNTIQKLLQTEGYTEDYEGTKVIFGTTAYKKQVWPHKAIVADLMKVYPGLNMRNTLMISHVPLDFHLYKVFKNFNILESYTGKLKAKNDFGLKVFKNEHIPFNKYTHLLLGDKWYLRSQVSPAVKRDIAAQAEQQRWNLLPDKSILEILISKHYVFDELLIRPDI